MYNLLYETETESENSIPPAQQTNLTPSLQLIDTYLTKLSYIDKLKSVKNILTQYSNQIKEFNTLLIYFEKIEPFFNYLTSDDLSILYSDIKSTIISILQKFKNKNLQS